MLDSANSQGGGNVGYGGGRSGGGGGYNQDRGGYGNMDQGGGSRSASTMEGPAGDFDLDDEIPF
jgi:single-strand DNA-binding protein